MTDGGPGRWVDLSVNRSNVSERAADYEEQVTGVPRGMEYQGDAPWRATNTIAFDGYDKASGTLLEAKGLGYAQHLDEDLEPKSYFKKSEKFEEIIGQAEDQYLFAQKHDLHLRWFVAEEKFALALQRRFVQDGLEIKVSYVPPMEKGANAL